MSSFRKEKKKLPNFPSCPWSNTEHISGTNTASSYEEEDSNVNISSRL